MTEAPPVAAVVVRRGGVVRATVVRGGVLPAWTIRKRVLARVSARAATTVPAVRVCGWRVGLGACAPPAPPALPLVGSIARDEETWAHARVSRVLF